MTRPHSTSAEVIVLQTPQVIEEVAARIERAYRHRRSQWRQVSLDPRVWSAAESVLMEAHRADPRAPLDPELFVACLCDDRIGSDPWTELTGASSLRRYLSRVRAILRLLREEIKAEVRRIRKAVRLGETLESALLSPSHSTTAIARSLVAVREGREDLVEILRPEARRQHESCPLYREATFGLFPEGTYPYSPIDAVPVRRLGFAKFSLN